MQYAPHPPAKMTVLDMLHEMVAPESKATLHERDAATEVLKAHAQWDDEAKPLSVPRQLAALILTYYEREHRGQMDTYLAARGA
jgi:hypothetical protein